MSFLKHSPLVFVIEDKYEILLNLNEYGLVSLTVGDVIYYEDNSGVLPSERTLVRIRVPQSELNSARGYSINYRKTVVRRAYFSEFENEVSEFYSFSPISDERDVNMYFVADVHYNFESAYRAASYFGESLDVLIAGGDLGEVETEENYIEVCNFLARITSGRIPIIFARGNHDARGRLAERFTDYFPSVDKRTYFSFDLGRFAGVVLDCGEDKPDAHIEYGYGHNGEAVYNGSNIFENYRRRETEFLRALSLPTDKPLISVSHICPAMTTSCAGNVFDIERDVYSEWNNELERLGIGIMISGHIHRYLTLAPNDSKSLLPHSYRVVFGAQCDGGGISGTAIILNEKELIYRFTDPEHNVIAEDRIKF